MRVMNKTLSYHFDKNAYTRFLQERGFTEQERDLARVYLYDLPPKARRKQDAAADCETNGVYSDHSIFLYANGRIDTNINRTLVHETSHFWDDICRGRELAEAYRTLTHAKYQKFFLQWLGHDENRDLAYEQRPGEIRARAYERQHTIQAITFHPIAVPVNKYSVHTKKEPSEFVVDRPGN